MRSSSTPSASGLISPCWTVMVRTYVASRSVRAHRPARIAAVAGRVRGIPEATMSAASQRRVWRMLKRRLRRIRAPRGTDTRTRSIS
ncbi:MULTISPECIES: hypothetical protein [unclassified Nocardioides]|uniref:hypothetical protein n=1 Tax=unclassified Nocardioides TaxID=2615069 RepID=UPI0010549031|nr:MULTISPECIES: hypothetical protein [unclassified Nocardioides]